MTDPRPTALVTGASYGVGAATSLALADAGYDVAISATRVENLDETLRKLKQCGARALPIALDLRAPANIERALADAITGLGHIDLLVNNAGTTLRRLAIDVTLEEWNDMMAVNVTGTFLITQQVGRHLIDRGRGGAIVNVASTHALVGVPEHSTYGIAKAALVQMTRMLAVEWAPHAIRVNAIAPGRMQTASPARAATGADPQYMQAMLNRVPLRRFCTAEEAAAAVAYLAGPSAASITGQVLVLDGGLTVV
jgi:NAD(P)-dependent dehydrogenase (short-subunit alcohol dehydrogenase family)